MNTSELIKLAEAFCTHRGVTLSTVSTWAVNDGKRLTHLKMGGGCTVKTFQRLVQFFSDNWPADLEWPRAISRPTKPKKEAA